MNDALRTVLLLYTDPYYLVKQVYPFGLDLLAGRLRRHGFTAYVDYPFLPSRDVRANISDIIHRTRPDVIGLGLRNIDTTMSCEEFGNIAADDYGAMYFIPQIREAASIIKELAPQAPMILGGGAFTVSPKALLDELAADFGVVGPGEHALLEFVKSWPDMEAVRAIPGLVHREGGDIKVNPRKPFAFPPTSSALPRETRFAFAYENYTLPVRYKHGCNQRCCYCVEPLLEGAKVIARDPDEVVEELRLTGETMENVRSVFFTDTEFNVPDASAATRLVEKIIAAGLHERFRFSSQFLPKPFDKPFAELLVRAGFSVIFSCESFADEVLEQNGMSYHSADMLRSIDICDESGLDATIDLIIGLTGESLDTVQRTLAAMLSRPPTRLRRYEYTFGGRIYQGTPLDEYVRNRTRQEHIYGREGFENLPPRWFCSPLPPMQLKAYVDERLPFHIEFTNRPDPDGRDALAAAFLVDRGDFSQAAEAFEAMPPRAQSVVFEYVFRKLCDNDRTAEALRIAKASLQQAGDDPRYADLMQMAAFCLGLLAQSGVDEGMTHQVEEDVELGEGTEDPSLFE